MLDCERFVLAVMSRLPKIADERDARLLHAEAHSLHAQGWTLDDAVAYLRCLEEAESTLSEDVAIARMMQISAKYRKK